MKSDILQRAKGVCDYGPTEKIARDKIIKTMRQVFESFGYNPIETPIIERYELFASKFGIGQESDAMRETFKLKDQGDRDLVLRTEFTVPFSRFVGMNPQFKKPFKRYQMGKVFRDGPIKLGRYREFWQCDVDVVGISDSIIDAELVQLTNEVFEKIGLEVEFRINNRKILNGILQNAGVADKNQETVIITIDKLDKVGLKGVKSELQEKGIKPAVISKILSTISIEGDNKELIRQLKNIIGDNEGLKEVEQTIDYVIDNQNVIFMPSLARGLAYYTGNVFEVYLKDRSKVNSSICAGGRFDSMIGGFLQNGESYPAVGISFGLETIFDAIKLYSKEKEQNSVIDLYFIPLSEEYIKPALKYCKKLRKENIKTDIDYTARKLKKNLEYANSYGVPWVVMLGEDEANKGKLTLRNMNSGEQALLDYESVLAKLKEELVIEDNKKEI
ncbi:histidine--tRNA ligase [Candidatus Kuenenbacteria bacterium]|nr:histidine--tRNA ligase [Candidatus Kuenenbacteria bacterium]